MKDFNFYCVVDVNSNYVGVFSIKYKKRCYNC